MGKPGFELVGGREVIHHWIASVFGVDAQLLELLGSEGVSDKNGFAAIAGH